MDALPEEIVITILDYTISDIPSMRVALVCTQWSRLAPVVLRSKPWNWDIINYGYELPDYINVERNSVYFARRHPQTMRVPIKEITPVVFAAMPDEQIISVLGSMPAICIVLSPGFLQRPCAPKCIKDICTGARGFVPRAGRLPLPSNLNLDIVCTINIYGADLSEEYITAADIDRYWPKDLYKYALHTSTRKQLRDNIGQCTGDIVAALWDHPQIDAELTALCQRVCPRFVPKYTATAEMLRPGPDRVPHFHDIQINSAEALHVRRKWERQLGAVLTSVPDELIHTCIEVRHAILRGTTLPPDDVSLAVCKSYVLMYQSWEKTLFTRDDIPHVMDSIYVIMSDMSGVLKPVTVREVIRLRDQVRYLIDLLHYHHVRIY